MLSDFIAHFVALALMLLVGCYYAFGTPRRRK
jgi:hypothetical protein